MKKLILLFALSTAATQVAAKQINDPEALYYQLALHFPEEEVIAGHSNFSISFENISCFVSSSRSSDDGTPTTEKECYAKSKLTKETYTVSENVDDLIYTLMNSGYIIDRASEPGTTYIFANDVRCMKGTLVGSEGLIFTCDDIL